MGNGRHKFSRTAETAKGKRRQFATTGEAQSYEKFVKEQAQDKP